MRARHPVAAVWKACALRLSLAPCLEASVHRSRPAQVWSGRMSRPVPQVSFLMHWSDFLSLWSADRGRPLQKPSDVCRRPSGTAALTDLSIWQTYQSSLAERRTRECQENEEEDDEEVLLPNKSFCFTAFILWHVVGVGGLALNNGDN